MADIRSFFGGGKPKPAKPPAKRKPDPTKLKDTTNAAPSDVPSPAKKAKTDEELPTTTAHDHTDGPDTEAPAADADGRAKKRQRRRAVVDSDSEQEEGATESEGVARMDVDDAPPADEAGEQEAAKPEPSPVASLFSPAKKFKASTAPEPTPSNPASLGASGEASTAPSTRSGLGGGWQDGAAVPYAALCDAFTQIEGTSGRLEITSIITKLLVQVMEKSPQDLEPTLYLACNKVAAPHANIQLGIGDALLMKAIGVATGRTNSALRESYKEHGDLGTVAMQSRASQRTLGFAAQPKPLEIAKVLQALLNIAKMEGNKSQDKKVAAIHKLLRDAKGDEARFLIRALQGKLRIGLAETTVLVALAHAAVKVQRAKMVRDAASSDAPAADDDPPEATSEDAAAAADRVKEEEPLACEATLRRYWAREHARLARERQASGASSMPPVVPAEVFEASVAVIKQAFAECSDHSMLARALLSGPLPEIRKTCHLVPGTPVAPMLAKPTKSVNEVLKRLSGQRLTVEFKYDGERMQLHRLPDGTIRIFSRSQEDTTKRWPELADSGFWQDDVFVGDRDAGAGQADGLGTFVLDAEVVAWDVQQKRLLPFQVLSTRKRTAESTDENTVQVIVQGFDLLYLNGQSLLRKPFIERRRIMYDSFREKEGRFTFAKKRDVDLREAREQQANGEGDAATAGTAKVEAEADAEAEAPCGMEDGEQLIAAFMGEAVEGSCEGLMVKTLYGAQATYEPSVRSLNWLKLKKDYLEEAGGADSFDLVCIGAYYGRGKRTGVFGAYLCACYDPESDEYQSVCKIGTGFKDEDLKSLNAKFNAVDSDGNELALPEGAPRPSNFVLGDALEPSRYFHPRCVWEVKAADLSLSSTHKGAIGNPRIPAGRGVGLRFPRFIREREDKPAEHATTASQVLDFYFEQQSVEETTVAAEAEEDDYL